MNGYLMNFFKYAAIDTEDFEQEDQMYLNAHEGEVFVRSVVWSVFDRIEIREIEKFEQFRLSQYSEKKWVGERQFTLLYEINPDKSQLTYQKSEDKCQFSFHKTYDESMTDEEKKIDERKYRFFGISMIDLAQEIHFEFYSKTNPGSEMHRSVYKMLEELCNKNNIDKNKICYEVYGTLGGNDLVIIWLANEYRDVVAMVEALRKSKIRSSKKSILANISTIMGLRDINDPDISYDQVKGHLNIRFTKKGTYDHEEFKEALGRFLDLSNLEFETTLGEHDLSLKMNGIALVKKMYNDTGFIHMKNETFLENIIQANTELSVDLDYEKLEGCEYKINGRMNKNIISLQDKEDVYKNIEKITENNIFEDLQYLKETLWILYEDYLKNISSAFSYPWIGDLHYQFCQSIVYLKELIKQEDAVISKSDKYDIIHDLIGTLRQTILHVSQANRLFFEIPNTHLKNTGSYSKVLRTYYGIVKQLLMQAYSIPKKSAQSIIVPFITFDVIPKIRSTMLPQLKECEIIIVNIVLPYEALVDLPKYAKLLAHEVYHYIAPNSREARNTEVGVLCISLFFSQILKRFLEYLLKEVVEEKDVEMEKLISTAFSNKINEKCLCYVVNEFETLVEYINDYDKEAEWKRYFKKIDSLYSKKSTRFAVIAELQHRVYAIFEETLNLVLESITAESVSTEKLKKIKEELASINVGIFCRWIKTGMYLNITDIDSEIKYALRETAADYFMLQVMKSETRIKNYYQLNLHYKKLLSAPETDRKQLYRIGIITDYLFSDITDKLGDGIDTEKIANELENKLEEIACLSREEQKYISMCFLIYYEIFKQYRKLIFLYLDSMNFSKIASNNFKKNLEKTISLLDEDKEDDFEKSVQYIERFQIQSELGKLENSFIPDSTASIDILDTIRKILDVGELSSITKKDSYIYAWDVVSFIEGVDKAVQEISEVGEPVWFRGHSSCKYKLLPSLYRMKDEKNYFYNGIKLRDVMEPLFKSFKVKAFGAREIYQGGDNSRIGVLASMQHYSVPTNILDWTPAAFVALYFAVEGSMVFSEKEKRARKEPQEDAEVWLLNPIRLNKAREALISRRIDPVQEYPIPSLYEDEEQYKEYIPFSRQTQPYNLPVAVYVPHINQRIKAQLGTFTMFSLDGDGKITDDGKNSYFEDLMEVQNRYKEEVGKDKYKPFLASIRISKSCIIDIADWLKRMGVTKPSIYPELTNVSKSLTGEMRDFWEKREEDTKKK